MNWEPEHDAQLRALWGGGKSASAIAFEMTVGRSRNSVIGRLHRLGLTRHDRPATARSAAVVPKIAERRERKKPAPKPPAPNATVRKVEIPKAEQQAKTEVAVALGRAEPVFTPTEYVERESLAVHRGLTLMELTDETCRWPRGGEDGTPISFCGQPPEAGSSYCPDCARIAYQQPGTLEQRAQAALMRAGRKKKAATYGRLTSIEKLQDDAT